jgi:hypothetical protein
MLVITSARIVSATARPRANSSSPPKPVIRGVKPRAPLYFASAVSSTVRKVPNYRQTSCSLARPFLWVPRPVFYNRNSCIKRSCRWDNSKAVCDANRSVRFDGCECEYMQLETLQDLYIHELKDLYSAEQQLIRVLPKMAKAANNHELAAGIQKHLDQT